MANLNTSQRALCAAAAEALIGGFHWASQPEGEVLWHAVHELLAALAGGRATNRRVSAVRKALARAKDAAPGDVGEAKKRQAVCAAIVGLPHWVDLPGGASLWNGVHSLLSRNPRDAVLKRLGKAEAKTAPAPSLGILRAQVNTAVLKDAIAAIGAAFVWREAPGGAAKWGGVRRDLMDILSAHRAVQKAANQAREEQVGRLLAGDPGLADAVAAALDEPPANT